MEASISEESVNPCLEDSEIEENEVPKLESSVLQDMYNELHSEFCKLAKEVLGLRKRNRELEKLILRFQRLTNIVSLKRKLTNTMMTRNLILNIIPLFVIIVVELVIFLTLVILKEI